VAGLALGSIASNGLVKGGRTAAMARYELSQGRSNKFWEVIVDGASLTTKYGRIGSAGSSTTKRYASAAAAKAAAETLAAQKQAKGYVKVGKAAKATANVGGAKKVAKKAAKKVAAKGSATKATTSKPGKPAAKARREPKSSPARAPSHAFVTEVLSIASDYDDLLMSSEGDEFPSDEARVHEMWERHQSEDVPDGVAWDDGAVSRELRERLQGHVERLLAEGRPDYHPGTGKIVRDVVHPSLFPFVKGRTKLAPGAQAPPEPKPSEHDFWGRPYERSKFQWLPTPFAVDRDGGVKILSYINNLDRNVYPEVYDDLAELFGVMLPLFESVYGYAKSVAFLSEAVGEHELPEGSSRRKASKSPAKISLRGRTLQVITKIVEYQLGTNPFESVWHVEGMSHENILATGVYVLDRDPVLEGGDLQLKRAYTQDEAGQLFWNVPQCRSEAMNDMVDKGVVPVGTLGMPAGRLLVFPNSHIHQLTPIRVTGGAKQARRRVIVAWLVNPERPILSTREVRPQQGTMSLADAEKHRLALMKERKLHKQSLNVRAVSLCEH
jgi:predicted DNA-binding WGR domain protein